MEENREKMGVGGEKEEGNVEKLTKRGGGMRGHFPWVQQLGCRWERSRVVVFTPSP